MRAMFLISPSAAILSTLVTFLVAWTAPDPPSSSVGHECAQGIPPETSQKIFALARGLQADHCKLEQLQTNRDVAVLRWSHPDGNLDVITIQPANCAPANAFRGPNLAISVPPSVRERCPETVRRLEQGIRTDGLGGVTDPKQRPRERWGTWRVVVAGVSFAAAIAALAAWLKNRRQRGKRA
jgi:hypothetical protein